jgi:hypothetical protein
MKILMKNKVNFVKIVNYIWKKSNTLILFKYQIFALIIRSSIYLLIFTRSFGHFSSYQTMTYFTVFLLNKIGFFCFRVRPTLLPFFLNWIDLFIGNLIVVVEAVYRLILPISRLLIIDYYLFCVTLLIWLYLPID